LRCHLSSPNINWALSVAYYHTRAAVTCGSRLGSSRIWNLVSPRESIHQSFCCRIFTIADSLKTKCDRILFSVTGLLKMILTRCFFNVNHFYQYQPGQIQPTASQLPKANVCQILLADRGRPPSRLFCAPRPGKFRLVAVSYASIAQHVTPLHRFGLAA